MSGFYASYIKAPWQVRESIANMVMLHVLPALFLEKDNPLFYVAMSSYVLTNRNLYILAMADVKGRKCQDPNNQTNAIGMTELFKDFCIENKCFDTPLPFASEKNRFKYFFDRTGHPDYELYEDFKGTVIMMSGVQGSGKDYTIKKLYGKYPIVGMDDTRKEMDVVFGEKEGEVFQATKEGCKKHMRIGEDFVFNATNTVKNIRSKWIRLFRQYGYRVVIHYVEKPMAVTLHNNKNREAVIPEDVIYDKFCSIDIPTLLECHELRLDVEA